MTTKFFPSLLLSVLFISNSTAFDGDIHDFYLPNGLKVILMEKHAAPKVAVSVFYNVGSKNEIDGQRGITRLIVNLMSKGTKKYSAEKATRIRTEYNAHYGDNSNRDRTYFYTELPVEYIGNEKVTHIKIAKMQLGSADDSGRRKPEIKQGTEQLINVDLVVEALGFEPENLPMLFNEPALTITQWGTLKINYKNMMTSLEGVFAAGDIIRGASLVVWGIKDGRDAAEHIHQYINNQKLIKNIPLESTKQRAVNE